MSSNKLKEELLIALAVSLTALFIATVLTLIIARYYKSIQACCLRLNCCPNDDDAKDGSTTKPSSKKNNGYRKMTASSRPPSLFYANGSVPPVFGAMDQPFEIPVGFVSQPIQPELRVDYADQTNGSSPLTDGTPSDTPPQYRRLTHSGFPLNFTPVGQRRKTASSSPGGRSFANSSEDEESMSPNKQSVSVEDLMFLNIRPELYDVNRRKTVGTGNLGKVFISLQYGDKSKKNLVVRIKNMKKLQTGRQETIGIQANVTLLPLRETVFTTTTQPFSTDPVFNDQFVFVSQPLNRDFESKTIVIRVHYTEDRTKDTLYGEARVPLLSTEIYSQVVSDVTSNIKSSSMQTEFGDLLIQLIYSESGVLSVMVKMMKLAPGFSLENMSGVRVKSYLSMYGRRHGRKQSFVCTLADSSANVLDLTGEFKFNIPQEDFTDTDLNLVLIGRYKILGKKTNLGKVMLSTTGKDQTGISHWRTIMNSPDVAWSVWHTIYAG